MTVAMLYDKNDGLKEKIAILPETPGVYQYLDTSGTVIYVGKAKNLKRRVSSYFNRVHDNPRTNILVRNIADMRYIVVPTEHDALNLENALIKEYKPRYNVLLKDDKSYPWIVVSNELYPRVFLTRQHAKDGNRYYGPYTNASVAHTVLDLINRLYPVRTCRRVITQDLVDKGKGHLCLQYHIKRCVGCCTGAITSDAYAEYIERIRLILKGDIGILKDYLRSEMESLSREMRFEEAQELKIKYKLLENYQAKSVIVSQTITDTDVFGIDDDGSNDVYINYMHVRHGVVVRSMTLHYRRCLDEKAVLLLEYAMEEVKASVGTEYREVVVAEAPETDMPGITFTTPKRGDKAGLLEISQKNAHRHRIDDILHLERHNPELHTDRLMERMQHDFHLSEQPRHIECFDNSNIQGTNPVASCVVFRDGKPCKRDYRHFIIKTVTGPDDFASMREVLTRRYSRMLSEGESLPQLIVVDGGKGQLSAAVEALDDLGLHGTIAVVGIAKRLEEIYFPGDSVPLYINKNSETLRVVQHLRDEAHRFGITHHRNRRSKSAISSELESIKGIGPSSIEKLLSHFHSVSRLRRASEADIATVIGPAKAHIVVTGLADML